MSAWLGPSACPAARPARRRSRARRSSSCSEETPRSNSTPSTRGPAEPGEDLGQLVVDRVHQGDPVARTAPAARPPGRGPAGRGRARPAGPRDRRSSTASVWPPRPRVPSTRTAAVRAAPGRAPAARRSGQHHRDVGRLAHPSHRKHQPAAQPVTPMLPVSEQRGGRSARRGPRDGSAGRPLLRRSDAVARPSTWRVRTSRPFADGRVGGAIVPRGSNPRSAGSPTWHRGRCARESDLRVEASRTTRPASSCRAVLLGRVRALETREHLFAQVGECRLLLGGVLLPAPRRPRSRPG